MADLGIAFVSAARVRALLDDVEREYVNAINAVLGCRTGSGPDPDRWRGHAEARRQIAEQLRTVLGEPPVDYTSEEWRTTHGVYPPALVAGFRAQAQAERNHEQRPECPQCGCDLTEDPHG